MKKLKNTSKNIKIKPFIDKYNWKDIEFPSQSRHWKKFEQNNKTIALNILLVPYNTKQIRPAYISKYNHERHDQVILLMITNNDDERSDRVKNWHYLAVKSISKLLREITSNHDRDFYCLNCFHSYTTKKGLKNMKKYVKIMISVM